MIDFSGRLIVHIGPQKTGSTSIQLVLDEEYERLREVGILFPKAGRNWISNPEHKSNHTPLVMSLSGELFFGNAAPETAKIVPDLKHEIDEANPHSIIISSEELARPYYSAEVLHDLKRIFPKAQRVWVVYVRSQDDLVLSHYAQRLRTGMLSWPDSIRHVMLPELLDHRLRLERLAYAVGEDKIVPVSFAARQGDLIESFFEAGGITRPSPLPWTSRANKSLPWRTLYCLRYANALPSPLRWRVRRIIVEWSRRIEGSRLRRLLDAKLPLTQQEAENLRTRYEASNRWVEETYWGGTRDLTSVPEAGGAERVRRG